MENGELIWGIVGAGIVIACIWWAMMKDQGF